MDSRTEFVDPNETRVLPQEILGHIFLYLAPRELDAVRCVSRAWRAAVRDLTWRQAFIQKFGTDAITPVVPTATNSQRGFWERESRTRLRALARWTAGGRKAASYDLNVRNCRIDHIRASFKAQRLVAWDANHSRMLYYTLPNANVRQLKPAVQPPESGIANGATYETSTRYTVASYFSDGTLNITTLGANRKAPKTTELLQAHRHPTGALSLWLSEAENVLERGDIIAATTSRESVCVSIGGEHNDPETFVFKNPGTLASPSQDLHLVSCNGCAVLAAGVNGSILFGNLEYCSDNSMPRSLEPIFKGPPNPKHVELIKGRHGYQALVVWESVAWRIDPVTGETAVLDLPGFIHGWAVDNTMTPGAKSFAIVTSLSGYIVSVFSAEAPVNQDGVLEPLWQVELPVKGADVAPSIAITPLVLAVVEDGGSARIYEVLAGQQIARIKPRFAKESGNPTGRRFHYRPYIDLDPDATLDSPCGVIALGNSVHVFEYPSPHSSQPSAKIRGRGTLGGPAWVKGGAARREGQQYREIEEEADEEQERLALPVLRVADYDGELAGEDALALALAMSQEVTNEDNGDDDDELAQALALSLSLQHSDQVINDDTFPEPIMQEDGYAQDSLGAGPSTSSSSNDVPSGSTAAISSTPDQNNGSEFDRDMAEAIRLSLEQQ